MMEDPTENKIKQSVILHNQLSQKGKGSALICLYLYFIDTISLHRYPQDIPEYQDNFITLLSTRAQMINQF